MPETSLPLELLQALMQATAMDSGKGQTSLLLRASVTTSYQTWTRVLNFYTDGTTVSFSSLWVANDLEDPFVPLELKIRAPRTLS